MYKNGQIITKDEHIEFANWNNANGVKFISEPVGDGTYKIVEIPEPPEPTVEDKNAAIAETRKNLYSTLIDPLHCEKIRKTALNEWTDEMESEYVAKVRELTEQIQSDNPYLKTGSENVQESSESGSENVAE